MVTKEKTCWIKKFQTYNNVIALTKIDISRKTVGKQSGNKKQRKTINTDNKRKCNYWKWITTKENIDIRRIKREINLQTISLKK